MNGIEGLHTQISGKYSPDNPDLFAFRQRLVDLGVDVRFPAGSQILEYAEEFAITVPQEGMTPFPQTEQAFMDSIGGSDFHIVYNRWGDEDGYIGESTAIEAIQALSHNIPTVWLRPFGRLSERIHGSLKIFIERLNPSGFNVDDIHIEPLDRMADAELAAALGRLANRQTGVSRWSAHVPRPAFDRGCYQWGPFEGSQLYLKDYTILSPFNHEDELEIFGDVKEELRNAYADSWHKYKNLP